MAKRKTPMSDEENTFPAEGTPVEPTPKVVVLGDQRLGNDERRPTMTITRKPLYEQYSTVQLGKGYYAVLDQFGDNSADIAFWREQIAHAEE